MMQSLDSATRRPKAIALEAYPVAPCGDTSCTGINEDWGELGSNVLRNFSIWSASAGLQK
jgi:hypothetical protein